MYRGWIEVAYKARETHERSLLSTSSRVERFVHCLGTVRRRLLLFKIDIDALQRVERYASFRSYTKSVLYDLRTRHLTTSRDLHVVQGYLNCIHGEIVKLLVLDLP